MRGYISDVNIWSRALTKTEMFDFTSKCFDSFHPNNPDILNWKISGTVDSAGITEVAYFNKSDLCVSNDSGQILRFFPEKLRFQEAQLFCEDAAMALAPPTRNPTRFLVETLKAYVQDKQEENGDTFVDSPSSVASSCSYITCDFGSSFQKWSWRYSARYTGKPQSLTICSYG